MYSYEISAGNPEGTDFTISVVHEKEFSKEEFNKIAEEAFVYALEKDYEKKSYAFISSIEIEFLCEYLFSKGFESEKHKQAYYHLEPYFNEESIKNNKLSQWINRENSKNKPNYLTESK